MQFYEFSDGKGVSFGTDGWFFQGRQLGDRAFTASNLLVSGDRAGNDITLWDLQTGERIRRFCNH
jgi:hypothetical protein